MIVLALEQPQPTLGLSGEEVYAVVAGELVAVSRTSDAMRRVVPAPGGVGHLAITRGAVFVANSVAYPHEGCLGSDVRRLGRCPTRGNPPRSC